MNTTSISNLPKEIQEDILSTLKAYSEVNIIFEYGEYHATPGISIKEVYAPDHKFIGTIKVEDIYTEEERTENYIECFHSYPIWYKGERDYKALKERFNE